MEHYWCLRWLLQEGRASLDGVVLRENLVRFDGLPLLARVPSLPDTEPGSRVRVGVQDVDLLERTFSCRYLESLGHADAPTVAEEAPEAP